VSSSVDGGPSPSAVSASAYVEVQQSEKFQELRRRHRSIAFPLAIAFLAWYFLYVLLSMFAPGFMGTRVFGTITIGLLLGLAQFVTTFAITIIYARWANRVFDPLADRLGAQLDARKEH
jgi:uncharacterized membrane protein (DUF485 family)